MRGAVRLRSRGVVGYHRLIVTKHLKVLVGMQMSGPQYGVPMAQSKLGWWLVSFMRMDPKRRKKLIALLFLPSLILFSILMTPVVWVVEMIQGTPDGEVRQYLTYLAEGDAASALAMVDPGIPNDQRQFLTNEVLSSASARLEIESVGKPKYSSSDIQSKTVTAVLRMNGHRFTHIFTVDRREKREGDSSVWKIRDGLFVTIPVSGTRVNEFSVGGVVAPVGADQTTPTEYVLFPGVYLFKPEGLGAYVDAPSATVVIENGARSSSYETASVHFDGTLNAELRGEALRAMRGAVQECATLGTNMKAGCPSEVRSANISELVASTLPATVENGSKEGSYVGSDAVISVRDTSGAALGAQPRDLIIKTTATVELSDAGVPVTDIDGKPVISVMLSIPSSSGDSPSS